VFLFVQDFERYDLCVSLFVLSAFGSILLRPRDAGPPRRDFFRPCWDLGGAVASIPVLKDWAIVFRPCRDLD
jgi:hypothetical protein